jgi:NAD+ kinase
MQGKGILMPFKFKRVGLIGKYRDENAGPIIRELGDYLLDHQVELLLDEETKQTALELPWKGVPRSELGDECDLIIVLGGDGTMLAAARELYTYGIPLVGVHLGRLGFLTDIRRPDLFIKIEQILRGHYVAEERFLLHTRIIRPDEVIDAGFALNDVVLHHHDVGRMIEFEVSVDDSPLSVQRSDGLIVCTPTGSTAYALSSGGPIMAPDLDAVALVPICPHTLSSRPIVISADQEIRIVVRSGRQEHAKISCDGQIVHNLGSNDVIQIHRQSQRLTLLHPQDYNYYNLLREKLHWG